MSIFNPDVGEYGLGQYARPGAPLKGTYNPKIIKRYWKQVSVKMPVSSSFTQGGATAANYGASQPIIFEPGPLMADEWVIGQESYFEVDLTVSGATYAPATNVWTPTANAG